MRLRQRCVRAPAADIRRRRSLDARAHRRSVRSKHNGKMEHCKNRSVRPCPNTALEDARVWTWLTHNLVNKRLNKAWVSFDILLECVEPVYGPGTVPRKEEFPKRVPIGYGWIDPHSELQQRLNAEHLLSSVALTNTYARDPTAKAKLTPLRLNARRNFCKR